MAQQTSHAMIGRLRDEHGTVLIQVAVALVVLIAFTMFVVDQGVMFVSRRQAQNSADAGALAGAIALAFDDFDNRDDNGPAKRSAHTLAVDNSVWAQAPDVNVTTDITFPPCPEDGSNGCIRVDVYRNQARSNPLPSWFGGLVGVTDQGVRATATARVGSGNATDCLKPWAVVDKWLENWPQPPIPWNQDSRFNKYINQGNNRGQIDPNITNPDVYTPPTIDSPGTGFAPFNPDGSKSPDYGRQMTLFNGNTGGNNDYEFGSGWFMALSLTGTGANEYGNAIKRCVGITYGIGDEVAFNNQPGAMVGPTFQAVGGPNINNQDNDSLWNRDPGAYWDDSCQCVKGSAYPVSPRIVPVAVVNPDMLAEAQNNGRSTVPIVNIVGFFVEGVTRPPNQGVQGRLMTMPGFYSASRGTLGPQSSFIKVIQLVR